MKKVLILGVNGFIGHHLSKRILETTDWEVYGMDMSSRAHQRPARPSAHALLRRRHHDQQGVGRVPRQEVRRDPAAGGDRHAVDLRPAAAARVRTGLRGQPADRALGRQIRQAPGVPVDLGSVWHVPRRRIRPGELGAGVRPDQQAALDLRLLQAADGPRDLGLRHGRPELHAVPSIQLGRRRPRFDPHPEGRLLARADPVPRPHRARRNHLSWSTAARKSVPSPTSTTASTR